MAQKQLAPLRMGTRQRFQKIGVVPFVAGQPGATIEVPRVGLVNRLVLQFRAIVTAGAGGAVVLANDGPYSLLQRIRVNLNTGSASIVDVTGWGAYLMQRTFNEFAPQRGTTVGVGDANQLGQPAANGSAALCFTLVIPVAANNGDAFALGTINAQAPEVRLTLETVFGALSDYGTNVASIAGSVHVGYMFYEVPPLNQYALPPLALVRMLEESQAVTNTGDNAYVVPRMGTLLSLAHALYINGARSDSFDEVSIRFNKSDTPYRMERGFERGFQLYNYGGVPEIGGIVHDFYRANEAASSSDLRDAIDTEEVSTLESVVTVSAAAGLGAGNNSLRSVRRILQVLEG